MMEISMWKLKIENLIMEGEMKSHIKAVHRDGDFDMKTWIKCAKVLSDFLHLII